MLFTLHRWETDLPLVSHRQRSNSLA